MMDLALPVDSLLCLSLPGPQRRVAYEGLDASVIERSDSTFPPPAPAMQDDAEAEATLLLPPGSSEARIALSLLALAKWA